MPSLKDELIAEAKHDALEMAGGAQEKISRLAGEAQAKAAEIAAPFARVGGNLETALLTSANDQPIATLAVIAAVGFVLGALWRS